MTFYGSEHKFYLHYALMVLGIIKSNLENNKDCIFAGIKLVFNEAAILQLWLQTTAYYCIDNNLNFIIIT
jgi:hypothetical protein